MTIGREGQPARSGEVHLPFADGLVGIAIILLLIGHWGRHQNAAPFDGWEPLAGVGVELLFVLSGFLVTLRCIRGLEGGTGEPFRDWLRRKALIVYPTLVLALLGATAIQEWKNGNPVPIERYGGFLSMFGNYYYSLAHRDEFRHALGHLWSIMVGAQFLVPWAIAMRWAYGTGRKDWLAPAAMSLFAASSLIRWAYTSLNLTAPSYAYLATEGRIADVVVGALAGVWAGRASVLKISPVHVWGAMGLAVVLAAAAIIAPRPELTALRLAAFSAVVLSLSRAPQHILARLLSWRVLTIVSVVSYSVFVWHLYGIDVAHRVGGGLPWMLRLLLTIAVTIAGGWMAYLAFERPFRRAAVRVNGFGYSSSASLPR